MTDRPEGLKALLAYVHAVRGIDFSLYRYATVRRKINLRVAETGRKDYGDYLEFLKAHPAEIDSLIKTITIRVSNFFRNPLVYELLAAQIIPDLASEFRFIKVWSIGCADGEEPYSVAMILYDLLKKEREHCDIRILGTDINADSVERAIRGEYREQELEEIKKKYVDMFFAKTAGQGPDPVYRISNEIKTMVQFTCEDMISRLNTKRARFDHYNLVLCRNVLIYMNRQLQDEIFRQLTRVVYDNGFLVLGETETMPESIKDQYVQVCPGIKIFRKKKTPGTNISLQGLRAV